ncbi:MAG: hypothetical protein H7062_04590 [Candidatus Saccharimonas sp.]|nr:hypothetical protein [Planctomycetaceae bacterium]
MSRRHDDEGEFSSNSFLDVICNVVGILIVLIVIAGVRTRPAARSSPPSVVTAPSLGTPTEMSPAAEEAALPEPGTAPELAATESDSPPMLVEPEPELEPLVLPELTPPPEMVERARQLDAELAGLRRDHATIAEALTAQHRQQTELTERIQTARDLLAERQSELNASRQQTSQQKEDLRLAKQTLARLLAMLKALEEKTPPVEALKHHITPVSRVVSGKEKHYRLDKNRVAEVPIEVLIVKLKDQIERRKDWLTRTRSHQGQVGPFAGFNMSYLVRIDMLNGLDELRAGHGGYRVSVASWEIVPEPDVKGETEQVALSPGSLFYESLLNADADTTLTFWVYPDSFPIYRRLQAFAHEQGFAVAARPLPKGIPIAGSPSGSKSASQ